MVAPEPDATRLGGVGDGDLDDPRDAVDDDLGGLVPQIPHPVLVVEHAPEVVLPDRAEPPRRGGLGVIEHRVVQPGDQVVAPVQPGQVGDARDGRADRLLLRAARQAVELADEAARAARRPRSRMWLWTSAENAARSYQCGDDGIDGVHFDHA